MTSGSTDESRVRYYRCVANCTQTAAEHHADLDAVSLALGEQDSEDTSALSVALLIAKNARMTGELAEARRIQLDEVTAAYLKGTHNSELQSNAELAQERISAWYSGQRAGANHEWSTDDPYRAATPARVDGVDPLPDAPVCGPNMYGDSDVCGCGDQECHGLDCKCWSCKENATSKNARLAQALADEKEWRADDIASLDDDVEATRGENRQLNEKWAASRAEVERLTGELAEARAELGLLRHASPSTLYGAGFVHGISAATPAREEPASDCADCANCGHKRHGWLPQHGLPMQCVDVGTNTVRCRCTTYVPAAREDQQ